MEYLSNLNIPILLTWMAADLLPEAHPAFCGRPGIYGQRAANIIQQKANSLAIFGARLDEQQVAYRYDNFAPNADIFIFDADQAELDKLPDKWNKRHTHFWDGVFSIDGLEDIDPAWLSWCKSLYTRFRPELESVPGYSPDYVDPFRFISWLSDYAKPDDIIVSGDGTAGEVFLQTFKVKAGQRLIQLSTNGAMGYDIPLAIGAAIGTGRRVLCVTGDGSFQLNAQELEVVSRLDLPIQFFVWNNGGYASIRNMQKVRFDGRVVGADPQSGMTLPELDRIAEAYGLDYDYVTRNDDLDLWDFNVKKVVEIYIDPDYIHMPRVATSLVDGKWQQDDMSDMTPKIDPEELREIMDE